MLCVYIYIYIYTHTPTFLVALTVKESCLQFRRPEFDPWVRKIPWRREWLPTPVFLPREYHGQRSLAGYSAWGRKESETTEQLTLTLQKNKRVLYPSGLQTSCFYF